MPEPKKKTCGRECEIYSRAVGYYRPLADWNVGKRAEFVDRVGYTRAGEQRLTEEPDRERIEKERASNPLFNGERKY